MSQPLLIAVGQGGIAPSGTFLHSAVSTLNKHAQSSSSSSTSSSSSPLPTPSPHPLLPLFLRSLPTSPLALFLDSESKLASTLPPLDPRHVVTSHTGFGGNWCRGFFTCSPSETTKGTSMADRKGVTVASPPPPSRPDWNSSNGPTRRAALASPDTLLERSMTSVYDITRSSSSHSPFFVAHSLTGGTGSGFTSRLLTELKDEYPKRSVYTYSLTPFVSDVGDDWRVTDSCGPVWAYNALLALEYLDEFADAVFLRSNADLLNEARAAKATKGRTAASTPVTVSDVNTRIAADFKGLLHPGFNLDRVLSDVVVPGDKYASVASSVAVSPRVSSLGEALESQAKFCSANVRRRDAEGRAVTTRAAHVVCRGYGSDALTAENKKAVYKVLNRGYQFDHQGISSGSPPLDEAVMNYTASPQGGKAVTVASLRSDAASYARHVITRANGLYEVGAYLRYFEELGKEDWAEAFERAWGIVERVEEVFDL